MIIAWILCMMLSSDTLFTAAPDDWVAEVIPFPLEFAPEIEGVGVEELRFAPGMFQEDAPDYFSYAFIWWFEGQGTIYQDRLQKDLLAYYKGLYSAVSKLETKDTNDFTANVYATRERAWIEGAMANYRGTVEWRDPFVTERPLTLEIKIATWTCTENNRTAVFFLLAPKGASPEVWEALHGLRAGACE